ncbi:hypothetical protein PNA2_1099 [Pyrococcus sp. NA2]|uniref:hypothetical protein n=1 Tax=Pyrococcus sp. (strain NA2) TaxID=342949 RepID=UPI000209AAED|nr:hypothetical protein [Pyrococcus sp. NA2]AEC52015.1 hypothetical protein PNA2_1099 [Pyrococcus sp. NA2]
MRRFLIFVIVWFLFVTWGMELSIGWIFDSLTGSWIPQSASVYMAEIWTINCLRFLGLLLLLRWLNLKFSELTSGKFGWRELKYSMVVVFTMLAVEIAYLRSYSPQILGEFRYHLRISPNVGIALLSLGSEYVYYTLEILAVNLLYLGSFNLGNERLALIMPALLWGFAHSLNFVVVHSIEALLLGIYAMIFALLMFWAVRRTESLKVSVFTWLVSMVL